MLYQIQCPKCKNVREVKAKKPWMIGNEPYSKICKSCCQKGKVKTKEHKLKLSKSAHAAQTEELLKKKSEFMKSHPELWKSNLIAGSGGGWNKDKQLPPRSEETKQKISEVMRKRRKGKK